MLPGLDTLETRVRDATEAQDPTAFLLADHDWLRDLLEAYRPLASQPDRVAEVRKAMLELEPRLLLHIRREEDAFFPAIEELMKDAGQGSTFDMYGEHDAIKIRLGQLTRALERHPSAAEEYGAFARSLLVHFENEEELIFAEASQRLSEEARREVLLKFERLESESGDAP